MVAENETGAERSRAKQSKEMWKIGFEFIRMDNNTCLQLEFLFIQLWILQVLTKVLAVKDSTKVEFDVFQQLLEGTTPT